MKKDFFPYFILIFVSASLIVFGFPDIVWHPNGYLMSDDIDAFKSYFNFSYHLRYGEGFKYDAVNYPYGDLLFYVNSHPVYQWILSWVELLFPSIVDYGPAIIHLSMFLSIVFASIFIYKILRHFSLPTWYAIVVALIIQFSYPQMRRIFGHFEMVFALSFPVYWYFLIRFIQSKSGYGYAVILVIWNLFVGLIGAYLVAINSVFSLAVGLVFLLNKRRNLKLFASKTISIFILSLIPLFAIKVLVTWVDWVKDRPENPWGFYNFYASPESLLQPYYFKDIFGVEFKTIFEGEAYLGFPALVFCMSLLFVLIKSVLRKKSIPFHKFFPFRGLNIYLSGALIVLIYAMCIPFRWGLDFIADTFPILKQFRSLGRFAWPFYYVFTVFISLYTYTLYRYFRKVNKPGKAKYFLAGILLFWVAESSYLFWDIFRIERPVNILLSADDEPFLNVLSAADKAPKDFQAIMSIPFMSTNGDKLIFWGNDSGLKGAMAFSYHTSLPIIQSVSPRLSFSNSLSSIQFLSDNKIKKTRLGDMNSKPILVITASADLNPDEKRLLVLTDSLTSWEDYTLRILHPASFDSLYAVEYQRFKDLKLQYDAGSLNQSSPRYYQSFDDREAEYKLTGEGAFYKRDGRHVLFSGELYDMGFSKQVELSLWMYIDERKSNMPNLILRQKNRNGDLLSETRINVRNNPDVLNRWVRAKTELEVDPGITYRLIVDGDFISVDDLLIRPNDSEILIKTGEETYLWNNYPFK